MKEIDTRMGFNKNMNYRNSDLFYLPMNYSNKRNLGYAFINFVDAIYIIDFIFIKGIKLKSNNCHKEWKITFANYQEELKLLNIYLIFLEEEKCLFYLLLIR